MNKLHDVMVYFCKHYPHRHDLSKARLTKLIYLADWISSLRHGRQVTDIVWEYNYYGPYVSDIIEMAEGHADFRVFKNTNMFGERKDVIGCTRSARHEYLDDQDISILDKVIGDTEDLSWEQFVAKVYATYPIQTQKQFSTLDLPRLARDKSKRK